MNEPLQMTDFSVSRAPLGPLVPRASRASRASFIARFATLMLGWFAGALLWSTSPAVRATERAEEADPPGRVGRIVELHGGVSRYDDEENRWTDAERNRPLTSGDRLSTAGGARAEVRIGSTTLRLGGATELEIVRLDDERLVFELHGGTLALRVRNHEQAAEMEVLTREVRLMPMRAGHYRIDRQGDTTWAGSWRGDLRVDDAQRLTAGTSQRLELTRDARTNELRHIWRGLPNDEFAAWATDEDRSDERLARSEHVSPEMTGAEDLDRWGAWDRHPEYGVVWYPNEVPAGWAPYRHGRWVWVGPWGWTWVDDARWGFAPFHYGRWVHWGGRWCWAPGGYVRRPVYAPALVAWVGGPGFGVSVQIGGPAIGWVPLAPYERWVPHYRATPVYIDRVNHHPRFQPPRRPGHPQTVPTGPIAYSNQGVPGAVTVVPRDVLTRREPVARAVVNVPDVQRAPVTGAPPAPPGRVATVPRAPNGRDPRADDGRPGRAPTVRPVEPPRVNGGPDRRPGGADARDARDARPGTPQVRPVAPAPPAQVVRPVQPAPSVRPATPAQGAQPLPRVQPAPSVQTPPPARAQPTQPPPARAQPAPAPRVQPAPRGDDGRQRAPQERRGGDRERDATR